MTRTKWIQGKTLALVMVFALALAFAAPAFAAPSVTGPTGLIFAPTADVLGANRFNFGVHVEESINYITFNMSPLSNLEFGVTNYSGRNWSDTEGNLKFRLVPESKSSPAVAAGIRDITDDATRSVYLVGSKNISGLGMRGHIGLDSDDGLFLGLSKQLNTVSIGRPGRNSGGMQSTFSVELYDDDLNLGVSLGLTPEWAVDAYLRDLDTAVIGVAYQSRF